METRASGAAPTPEEARQSLHLAEQEESATVNRPVPGWYFPTLAALLLVMFLLNALGRPDQPVRGIVGGLVIACALLVAVLVGRVSFGPSPYRGVRVRWTRALPGIIIAAILALLPVLLADTVGSWIWAVCGIVLAGLLATAGTRYWQQTRRA